jgi:SAM-dependent methyltransferase
MVAITSLQREHIIESVQAMYTEVARNPGKVFHFPTGRRACEFVGYPAAQLDAVPATAVESFAGVGYPFTAEAIRMGDAVLDVGSGSGTDAFISAQLTGDAGKVFALDITAAMRNKLRNNVRQAAAGNIDVIAAEAEHIPLRDGSIDVVSSNGVLNLVPDKRRAFSEIFRVLKPGGWAQVADIVVNQEVSEMCRQNPKLWAECIVGAMEKDEYLELLREVGFSGVSVLQSLDYFSVSVSADTRKIASSLGAHSIVMQAVKP